MGFAVDRAQARQLVNHGHILINNSRADIASMLVRPGDMITVEESARRKTFWKEAVDFVDKRLCPVWIERDGKNLSGRILRIPDRSEIDGNLNEQLIVEYYSR
jgi:small subunit ribosomal protein S4